MDTKICDSYEQMAKTLANKQQQIATLETVISQYQKEAYSFQQMINCLDAHIYWKNEEGKYLICNQAVAEFHGKDNTKEIVGKTDYELFPEHIAKTAKDHDLEIMSLKETVLYDEYESDKKLHFLSRKSPLFDENQKLSGIVGVSIDITERKKLELELRDKKNQLEKRLAFQKHYIKSYGYDYISALKLISESIENIEARLMQLDIPQTVRSDLNDEFYQVNESLSEIYTLYQKINTAVLQQDERAKIVTVESTLEEIIENEVGLANTFISSDLKTKVTYQIEPLARQKLLIDYAKVRHIIRTFLANFTNSVSAQNSHDINLTVTAKAGLRSNTLYVTFSFDGGTPFLEFEGDTIRAEHLLNHSLNHIPGSKHSLAYELALAKSYIELLCDGEELNDAIFDQQQLSFTLPFKKMYYKDKAPKLTVIINEVSD